MDNVDIIDLDLFEWHHFSVPGMHLNFQGIKKLAYRSIFKTHKIQ